MNMTPEQIVAEPRQMDILTTRRQSAIGAVRAAGLPGAWVAHSAASDFVS